MLDETKQKHVFKNHISRLEVQRSGCYVCVLVYNLYTNECTLKHFVHTDHHQSL